MGRKNGIWIFRYLFALPLRRDKAYTAGELSLGWCRVPTVHAVDTFNAFDNLAYGYKSP
jgi:hypothetical protein